MRPEHRGVPKPASTSADRHQACTALEAQELMCVQETGWAELARARMAWLRSKSVKVATSSVPAVNAEAAEHSNTNCSYMWLLPCWTLGCIASVPSACPSSPANSAVLLLPLSTADSTRAGCGMDNSVRQLAFPSVYMGACQSGALEIDTVRRAGRRAA